MKKFALTTLAGTLELAMYGLGGLVLLSMALALAGQFPDSISIPIATLGTILLWYFGLCAFATVTQIATNAIGEKIFPHRNVQPKAETLTP